jgi:hypothetical protein
LSILGHLEEEIKELWTPSNEEQILEPEIEEFLACIDPLCIEECESQNFEDLWGVTKTYMQADNIDVQGSQGMKDYIEEWFQTIIRPRNHFLLQHFLASNQSYQLASHIQTTIKVHLPYLDMSLFLILLRTWFHWKYSYT